jgi:cell division protein FtsI/penicillin-binding protein 2
MNMEYRYFYRLGSFTKPSQVKQYVRHEGAIVDAKFVFECEEKFDNCGWDVRSWKPDNVLQEISEDSYKEIVKSENSIKKEQRELGLKEGHHFPVKLSEEQVMSMKEIGMEIIEI